MGVFSTEFRVRGKWPTPSGAGLSSAARADQSRPFFFMMSSALFLSISMVGKVMTGGIFSPFRSLTACRSPSAPGVA